MHPCSQQVDRGEVQVFMAEVGRESVLVAYLLLLLAQMPQLILLNETQHVC